MTFRAAVERGLACRDARDHAGLLAALLEVWRLCPDETLADYIEELSLRFEPPGFLVPPRGQKLRAWEQAVAAAAPHELPALINVLQRVNWAPQGIESLARRPPDPRIGWAMARLRGELRPEDQPMDTLRVHAPPPASPPADADYDRLLGPAREAQATEKALLERIWADPFEDAPRRVYADWLLERGHPRGEFINLQLDRGDDERLRLLLRRFFHDWLRPLGDVVFTGSFARGFFAQAILKAPGLLAPLVGRPEWGTVQHLNYAYREVPDVLARLVTHPVMRSLRELHGLVHEAITALAAAPPTSLATLGFIMNPPSAREAAILAAGEAFPRVRTLYVGGAREALAWLPGSAFGARLDKLDIVCPAVDARLWVRDLHPAAFPGPVERTLTLREGGSLELRDGRVFAHRVSAHLAERLHAWGVTLEIEPA